MIIDIDKYLLIKKLLLQKNLTQYKLAEKLNVSQQLISQIIRGTSDNQAIRQAIEEILGERIWTVPSISTKAIGEIIQDTRIKKEISLKEFAEKLGCPIPYVSDIERGRFAIEKIVMQAKIEEILGEKIWTCETGVTQNNEIVANSHLSIYNNKFNNNIYKKDANLVGDQNSLPQENSNINNQNNNRGNTQNTKTRGLNRAKQVSAEAQELENFYFKIHLDNGVTVLDNQRNKFAIIFDELLKKHDKQELKEVIKFKIKSDFF